MSDSDNEFGSLAPTTPLVPVRKRSRPPESRPVAGPSKIANKTSKGRPKTAKKVLSVDDVETIDVVHKINGSTDAEDDEVVEVPPSAKHKGSNTSVRSESVLRNGAPTVKGKEKAKDDPSQPRRSRMTRKAGRPIEATVISDGPQVTEDTETEPIDQHGGLTSKAAGRGNRPVAPMPRSAKADIFNNKELERLRQKLDEAETQRDTFAQQLDQLFRLRNTDAEKLLEQQVLQYEAQIRTQEMLIKELTAQAARTEPLIRTGKGSILHLVTREAADEEKRFVERDLTLLQNLANEKDNIITQNQIHISELQQSVDDLRSELQVEIDRNRQLAAAARQPSQSQTHTSALGVDSPKNTTVVRLYEDLTNFLISGLRFLPGKYGDETLFTCFYTHVDPTAAALEERIPGEGKSVSFTLRFYKDIPEDEDPQSAEFVEKVQYTPQGLDKESHEFIEQLAFLGEPFTFQKDQLPMFLHSLQMNMAGEKDDGDGDMDIEEV